MSVFVTLDNYTVRFARERAIGLRDGQDPTGPLVWIPRSCFENADLVDVGDEDLSVKEWIAIKEGLRT